MPDIKRDLQVMDKVAFLKKHGVNKSAARMKVEEKDEQEYDYEGDMVKSDLRSIMANAQRIVDMVEDNDNLPEWCQSKVTIAEDYISTVANYMTAEMNEEVEQLDELSPETLQSYKDKAKDSAEAATAKGDSAKSLKRWSGHMKATGKQIEKTTANIRKALNREEVEQIDELDKSTLKSYSDKAKEQLGVLKKVSDTLKDKGSKAPWERGIGVRTKGVAGAEKRMAKEDVEQIDEKNEPTSPEKWAKAKAQAKAKFDVYPSAYANGWAAKKYKEMGGGWKSVSEGYFSDKDIENQEIAKNPGMRSPRKPEPPPFEGPYKKKPSAKPGKFGAGYSTAKHLAKAGMKKAMGESKEVKLSKKAQIVKDAAKKNNPDKFEAEPQLSNSVTKNM